MRSRQRAPMGPPMALPIQKPFATLHLTTNTPRDVARILRDALVRHPCDKDHPWNIVFYQDGVDPSDGLAKTHSRTSNVFYWSFLELGLHALCHEECWFAVTLVRDNTSKSLVGGITQASALALDSFSAPTLMGITLHVTVALWNFTTAMTRSPSMQRSCAWSPMNQR